jgi:hypothetical protein
MGLGLLQDFLSMAILLDIVLQSQGASEVVKEKCLCEKYHNQTTICVQWICPRDTFANIPYFPAPKSIILQHRKNETDRFRWNQEISEHWEYSLLFTALMITLVCGVFLNKTNRARSSQTPSITGYDHHFQISEKEKGKEGKEKRGKKYFIKSPKQLEEENVKVFSKAYRNAYPSVKRISL